MINDQRKLDLLRWFYDTDWNHPRELEVRPNPDGSPSFLVTSEFTVEERVDEHHTGLLTTREYGGWSEILVSYLFIANTLSLRKLFAYASENYVSKRAEKHG